MEKHVKNILLCGLLLGFSVTSASGKTCGGDFESFVKGLKGEALEKGYSKSHIEQFFASVAQDPKTIKADRAQGVFHCHS